MSHLSANRLKTPELEVHFGRFTDRGFSSEISKREFYSHLERFFLVGQGIFKKKTTKTDPQRQEYGQRVLNGQGLSIYRIQDE